MGDAGRIVIGPHPALAAVTDTAERAYRSARRQHDRHALAEHVADGADGTPSMRIDVLVEEAVIDTAAAFGINVLSEERGWVDHGSALTLVVDPVDGSANAAAGVPLACFSVALAVDERFVEGLTAWLHTGERWHAVAGEAGPYRTTGREHLAGAAVSLLRPHAQNRAAWWRVAEQAGRIRVLGCSTLDAVLTATGAVDAFVDACSDTHRLVDLAAATVLVPAAGGVVVDAQGRRIELDLDLTRRWSGVVAASPRLADEICEVLAGGGGRADPRPRGRLAELG